MSSKRQTTMAKLQRERRVEEKRTLKREKKQAAAAARKAGELPEIPGEHDPDAIADPDATADPEAAEEQSSEISATLDRE
jgi:hypothetical protein